MQIGQATAILLALTAWATSTVAHGIVTTPSPRVNGEASLAACGTGASNVLKSNTYGPIENALAKVDSGYNASACNLFFCRGYQFSDNASKVQKYQVGQTVNFHVDLQAHHTGRANVSVFNLATHKAVGAPLLVWPVYANDSLGPSKWPANETDFSIKIPDLGTQCATAGKCAIQWWWYANNKQTYESCIDFTTA